MLTLIRDNTTIPDSTLKSKSQIIAYHILMEGVARDECRMSYVNTYESAMEHLKKVLPMSDKI